MALPNSKDVYTTFLLLLFLSVLLILLRYIRSREGFQNPPSSEPAPEEYDLNLFFKTYPLLDICPIFKKIYDQLVKGESVDEKGNPLPNDIAQENANKKLSMEITIGQFPCPFTFPTNNSLDVVAQYVEGLDKRLLSKAKLTMMFCVVSLQSTLEGAKKSVAQIPKTEGFISECSPEEIMYKDIVPLQCIPAESMKATEKQEIDKMDKQKQIQIVAKKQSIAKRLAEIYNDLQEFNVSYAQNIQATIEFMRKDAQKAMIAAKLAEKASKDSEDEEKIKRTAKAKEEAETKKSILERVLKYQAISGKSIADLVSMAKALEKETEDLQKKLESGNLSF
jgi:hypothetical protein